MKVLITNILLIMVILSQSRAAQLRMLGGLNCGTVDESGNCITCYFRYVLIEGSCVAVSDQCKTWDPNEWSLRYLL